LSKLLGLDIGASHSRARLCVAGQVTAEARAAGASLTTAGATQAGRALTGLLAALPLGPEPDIDAVCAGSAGISAPGAREFLHGRLAPLTPAGPVVIVHDAQLVLPAAGLDSGIAVICGTGSAAVGAYRGRQVRAGGWGYLLGDEGSGYAIVRAALRVLLDRRDAGAPPGDLAGRLLAATGAPDVSALQERFYADPRPGAWAAHAPLVLASPDPAAAAIRSQAAAALAALAAGAAARLSAPPSLPVVLAGGLARDPGFAAAACAALRAEAGFTDVRRLTVPPVAGAIRLAAAALAR
jgi:N-acetylglucosamine kinase-like BadF-type ATPase